MAALVPLSCPCQEVSKAAPPPPQVARGIPARRTPWLLHPELTHPGLYWAAPGCRHLTVPTEVGVGGHAGSSRAWQGAGSVAGPAGGRGRSRSPSPRPLPPQPPSLALPGGAGRSRGTWRRQLLGGARGRRTGQGRAAAVARLGTKAVPLYIEAPGACPVPGGGGAGGGGRGEGRLFVPGTRPAPPTKTLATHPRTRGTARESQPEGQTGIFRDTDYGKQKTRYQWSGRV